MIYLPSLVTVVLFVLGTVVYRWQKAVDRETLLQGERRKKYDAYIEARLRAFDVLARRNFDQFDPVFLSYFIARDQLLVCAPTSVLGKLDDHSAAFDLLRRTVGKIAEAKHCETEVEFRAIVQSETDSFFEFLSVVAKDLVHQTKFVTRALGPYFPAIPPIERP